MRIIFKPRFVGLGRENALTFVAVTDDSGTPIPDDRLTWTADGEHEALCIDDTPPDVERLTTALVEVMGAERGFALDQMVTFLIDRGVKA